MADLSYRQAKALGTLTGKTEYVTDKITFWLELGALDAATLRDLLIEARNDLKAGLDQSREELGS